MKKFVFARFVLCTLLAAGFAPVRAQAAVGDLYDGGLNDLAVYKFDPAGNRTVFKSGSYADWLAFDSKGNLFAGDPSDNVILKITPAGVQTNFATAITPGGIAFDTAGNLFAINMASAGSILKYTPSGAVTTFVANLGGGAPTGLIVDASGNLYVSFAGNNLAGGGYIAKFAPNGTRTLFASGLFLPAGFALDSGGNIYVADLGSGSIFRFTPGGTKTTFTTGLSAPRSLAFDSNGILYAGEFGTHDIVKFPGGVKTAFSHDNTSIGGLAFEPATAQLTNISTRASVQTGQGVTIGGFIVTGTALKTVVLRGLGPTLALSGVTGVLADPTLQLFDGSGNPMWFNDNWKDTQQVQIQSTGLAPPNDLESAILFQLQPGNYTAQLAGKNGTTGIGLVEVYDISPGVFAELTNVSTRGFVGTGQSVMIGGFITGGGNGSTQVVVRGLGPTLTQFGVSGALADPVVTLVDGSGNVVKTNDNWKNTQQAAIEATGLAPPNDLESAMVVTVSAGNYTAILSGKNGGSGIGLIEVYKLR
ncbi:MAG TPA: NHL repeat-containing protein [Patescibacteria group bacterium]|nr:NHL repeat-containing protein [Patescibacteria group bacterium]